MLSNLGHRRKELRTLTGSYAVQMTKNGDRVTHGCVKRALEMASFTLRIIDEQVDEEFGLDDDDEGDAS